MNSRKSCSFSTGDAKLPGSDRELDIRIAVEVIGIKEKCIGNLTAETADKFPYYVPSGKPWRTHSIDGRPLPGYTSDEGCIAGIMTAVRDRFNVVDIRFAFSPEGECDVSLDGFVSSSAPTMSRALCNAAILIAKYRKIPRCRKKL